jgi:predicted TIM-barrel fold metal-dependent hydrolase
MKYGAEPSTIDAWAQVPTARFLAEPWLDPLLRWTGQDRLAATADDLVAAMDEAGIERALVTAWYGPAGDLVSNDEVARTVAGHPGRLFPVVSVDLRDPMGAVREIRHRADQGAVAVRVVPWLWDLPPDHRRYAPVYVACIETGLPFCTQIGHTGPLCPSEPGRPIPYLDAVLLDFPELVVVGGHVGVPWIDEVLSLCHKYPNFSVDTSAYAVHRLPPALVDYMRGHGRTRVLFGTNFPMLTAARALARLDELRLDDEARALFLGGNAARIFFGARSDDGDDRPAADPASGSR